MSGRRPLPSHLTELFGTLADAPPSADDFGTWGDHLSATWDDVTDAVDAFRQADWDEVSEGNNTLFLSLLSSLMFAGIESVRLKAKTLGIRQAELAVQRTAVDAENRKAAALEALALAVGAQAHATSVAAAASLVD